MYEYEPKFDSYRTTSYLLYDKMVIFLKIHLYT